MTVAGLYSVLALTSDVLSASQSTHLTFVCVILIGRVPVPELLEGMDRGAVAEDRVRRRRSTKPNRVSDAAQHVPEVVRGPLRPSRPGPIRAAPLPCSQQPTLPTPLQRATRDHSRHLALPPPSPSNSPSSSKAHRTRAEGRSLPDTAAPSRHRVRRSSRNLWTGYQYC